MKKITSVILIFTMACFTLVSCQESSMEEIEPVQKGSVLSSSKNMLSFANSIKDHYTNNANASNRISSENGAHFIAPFTSTEGQGIFDFDPSTFSLKVAFFEAPFEKGDFYRQNPDGTVSVHINSTKATAIYAENAFDPSSLRLSGKNAHFSANYTGTVVEDTYWDWDCECWVPYQYIDTYTGARSAVSWSGSGKVGLDGAAPSKTLTANLVQTPGGQVKYGINLK
jgi:hypothetical protein